jgi:cell wall-associated NlpC family hydrolase
MKRLPASLLLLLFLAPLCLSRPEVTVSFKKNYTVLAFNGIRITGVEPCPGDNKLVLKVSSPLAQSHTVVDYRAVKTISFYKDRIEVLLSYGRNYALSGSTLMIIDSFPQTAFARSQVTPVRDAPREKAALETELLQGALCRIVKNKKSWLYVEIPDQKDHSGWIREEDLNLLVARDLLLDGVVSEKMIIMTCSDGTRRSLQGGTPYRILNREERRLVITLADGTTGTIPLSSSLSGSSLRDRIVETAQGFLGVPYVWGGTSSRGLDCSGLTWLVYRMNGMAIPRDGTPQYKYGQKIPKSSLQPGDLVFFSTFKPGPSHVGIYMGASRFIHAATEGVRVSSLEEPYYAKRFYGCVTLLQP